MGKKKQNAKSVQPNSKSSNATSFLMDNLNSLHPSSNNSFGIIFKSPCL